MINMSYNNYAAIKAERKALKQAARANMVNPYKIGDILYDSWGYDQTNIDFYQIVEVKKKSVIMRPIGGEMVESYRDSGKVKPVKDKFIGEEIKKLVQVFVNGRGEIECYIKSAHGWISKYEKGENGTYCSWGY